MTIHQRFAAFPDSMSWRSNDPMATRKLGKAPPASTGTTATPPWRRGRPPAGSARGPGDAPEAFGRWRRVDPKRPGATAGTTSTACGFVRTARGRGRAPASHEEPKKEPATIAAYHRETRERVKVAQHRTVFIRERLGSANRRAPRTWRNTLVPAATRPSASGVHEQPGDPRRPMPAAAA